ncbi:MAG: nickel-responsive transcriptional regulator NikR [Methylocella sp.]
MQRVTVTFDDELVAELDRFMKGRGYHNRSEAIRDLARAGMQQPRGGARDNGDCVAALIYVYDHTVRELAKRLADAHHHHHDLSVAAMQVHLDHASCMEVALLRGGTREVHHFAEQIIAERGVRHGRLVAVPVEVQEETHSHGNDRAKRHPHVHVRHVG